jgi:hypothetical protein
VLIPTYRCSGDPLRALTSARLADNPPRQGPLLLLSGSLPVTSTQAELLAFRDAEWKSTSDLIKAADIKLE